MLIRLLYYLTCKTLLTFFLHAHCGNQLLLTMLAWLNKVYHHHQRQYFPGGWLFKYLKFYLKKAQKSKQPTNSMTMITKPSAF